MAVDSKGALVAVVISGWAAPMPETSPAWTLRMEG